MITIRNDTGFDVCRAITVRSDDDPYKAKSITSEAKMFDVPRAIIAGNDSFSPTMMKLCKKTQNSNDVTAIALKVKFKQTFSLFHFRDNSLPKITQIMEMFVKIWTYVNQLRQESKSRTAGTGSWDRAARTGQH